MLFLSAPWVSLATVAYATPVYLSYAVANEFQCVELGSDYAVNPQHVADSAIRQATIVPTTEYVQRYSDVQPLPRTWYVHVNRAYNSAQPVYIGLVRRTFLQHTATTDAHQRFLETVTSYVLSRIPADRLALSIRQCIAHVDVHLVEENAVAQALLRLYLWVPWIIPWSSHNH